MHHKHVPLQVTQIATQCTAQPISESRVPHLVRSWGTAPHPTKVCVWCWISCSYSVTVCLHSQNKLCAKCWVMRRATRKQKASLYGLVTSLCCDHDAGGRNCEGAQFLDTPTTHWYNMSHVTQTCQRTGGTWSAKFCCYKVTLTSFMDWVPQKTSIYNWSSGLAQPLVAVEGRHKSVLNPVIIHECRSRLCLATSFCCWLTWP